MPARIRNNNGELIWRVGFDDSSLPGDARRIERTAADMSSRVVREGDRMEMMFTKLAAGAAVFFSAQQGMQLVNNIVKVRGEFQQLDIAFTTMLQSKAKADTLMAEVVTLAANTPFGLKDAAQGAKQLLAYGSAAESVIGELRMIGDIASGVSVPLGDLIYLYGTLKTQGRAYAVDIRQFAGRGIPIYAELAKVMGVAKDQVAGLVESGKVGFPEVEKAFKNMTSSGGMFFNLMEKQSKSLTGQIERLKDSIDIMFNEMGESSEGVLNGAIQSAGYLVENYKEVAKILGVLIATYGAYRVAVAAVAMGEQYTANVAAKVEESRLTQAAINQKRLEAKAEFDKQKAAMQAHVSAMSNRKDELVASAKSTQNLANEAALKESLAKKELADVQLRIAADNELVLAKAKNLAAEKQLALEEASINLNQTQMELAEARQMGTSRQIRMMEKEAEMAQARKHAAEKAALSAQAIADDIEATGTQVGNAEVLKASKKAQLATDARLAAEDKARIIRQQAIAAGSDFIIEKQNLENFAKNESFDIASKLAVAENKAVAGKGALAASTGFATTAQQFQNVATNTGTTFTKVAVVAEATSTTTKTAMTFATLRAAAALALQKGMTDLATKAQALLNATMLNNPVVLITAAIGGLVAAYISFRDSATEAEVAQKRLDDAINKHKEEVIETKVKVNDLVAAIKDENLTNDVRAKKLSQLQVLTNGRLGQLTLEAFRTGEATKAIDEYVAALDREARAKAQQDIKIENYKRINELNRDITDLQNGKKRMSAGESTEYTLKSWKAGLGGNPYKVLYNEKLQEKVALEKQNKELDSALKEQNQNSSKKVATGKEIVTKDKQYWEDQKKSAQASYDALDEIGRKSKAGLALANQIREADQKISGYNVTAQDKAAASAGKKAAKAAEKYAEEQKRTLNSLTEAERQATVDRMIEGEKQVAEIQDRYEKMRQSLRDAKITDHKKFESINAMEQTALSDLSYQNDTKNLGIYLEDQKKLYAKFEDYKKEYGLDAAKEEFAGKIDVESSYLSMVQEMYDIHLRSMKGKMATASTQQRDLLYLGEINTGKDEEASRIEAKVEAERQSYIQLLDEAGNYQFKLLQLEKQKKDRLAGLERDRTKLTEVEYRKRQDLINGYYQAGIKELEVFGQDIFKKLGNNLEVASKDSLDETIAELDKIVKSGKFANGVDVPPQVLLNLKNTLEQIKGIRSEIDGLEISSSKLGKVATTLQSVGANISNIGQTLSKGGFSGGETIAQLGSFISQIGDAYVKINKAVDAVKAIQKAVQKSGTNLVEGLLNSSDLWGAILAVINIIVEVIGGMGKAKAQLEQLQRNLAEMNAEVYLSEYSITEQMREQNMLQAESIELTRAQLREKKKVAEENDRQIAQQIKDIEARLLSEGEYISNRWLDEKNWFLGKDKIKTEYTDLQKFRSEDIIKEIQKSEQLNQEVKDYMIKRIQNSGLGDLTADQLKNLYPDKILKYRSDQFIGNLVKEGKAVALRYEDLNKLYEAGLLEGATKALFEQLKSLQEQGVEVDKILQEIEQQQKELDTGTSSGAVADSIVEGFKDGKRSAKDFAEDFENMMRQAMLNGLRYDEEFEARTKEWYDKFAQYAADGVVDATEKGILNKDYADLINDQNKKAKLLEDATGVSLTDKKKDKNSLSGAISGASQESIDVLSSHSMRQANAQLQTNILLTNGFAESFEVANRSLEVQLKIERNTFNTVLELKSLNNKIQSGSDVALAMGGTL